AIFAIPFMAATSAGAAAAMAAGSVGGASLGAAAGAIDADTRKEDYGISEDFVQRVGTMVQPGDSAIFALLRSIDPELVAAQFKGYGGTILRTTLTPAQREKVEETADSARESDVASSCGEQSTPHKEKQETRDARRA